jgi:homogentisate 1,2-dioxygenase
MQTDRRQQRRWQQRRRCAFTVYQKFLGKVVRCRYAWSVFDVVAWWGNYIPYKFDIALFSPVGSVLKDHPFTVLTSPTDTPGTAACDFVVFSPRWIVMDGTFRYGNTDSGADGTAVRPVVAVADQSIPLSLRVGWGGSPPWFHRNCMTEFTACVRGHYDDGFDPGQFVLHSNMSPHGVSHHTIQNIAAKNPAKADRKAGAPVPNRTTPPLTSHSRRFAANYVRVDVCHARDKVKSRRKSAGPMQTFGTHSRHI